LDKHLLDVYPESIYLDLERPSDLRKLEDAEWFLTSQKDKLKILCAVISNVNISMTTLAVLCRAYKITLEDFFRGIEL